MRLVAFPFHDYRKGQAEGFRTRDLHLIGALAAHPDVESVLVVDRPVSLAERLARRVPWAVSGKLVAETRTARASSRLTDVGSNVVVLDQAVPDLLGPAIGRREWWFDVFENPRTADSLRWAVSEGAGSADAAIVWLPAVAPVVLDSNLPFVFDSLDNWLIHPAFARQRARSAEAYCRVLPAAEAVFVSGPASRSVLAQWRDDISILPNGVDIERFSALLPRPRDLPAGPIIGYAGKLAERIDVDLVLDVARTMPGVTFVFLGPVLEPRKIAGLRHVANVRLLGDRPYDRLAAYLQHFTVGWIPHRVGKGETGGDPIKLHEYLAAGLPVVSTPLDGWEAWGPCVAIVRDAREASATLASIVSGAMRLPEPVVPMERTWGAIAERLLVPLKVRAEEPSRP
jgi:glycosyltransferase involved in cell wall biosynthesis